MTTPPKSKSEMKRLAVQSALGPLEFKAEDFLDKDNPVRDALPECFRRFAENMALFCAEQANALLAERLNVDELVNRFLSWPLPETVCSDACVLDRSYPHRIGTNLLTADEARQMFEYVFEKREGK